MPNEMLQRVVVIGAPGTGKSQLAERLAAALRVPFVEMDALYWKPGWVDSPAEEFSARLAEATARDRWVVAGNYTHAGGRDIWPRADCVVWIDLPLRITLPRLLLRSWRRWRTRELLWGTNIERFWPQLRLWDAKTSLLSFSVRTHATRRRNNLEAMRDPAFASRFLRLTTPREVEEFARGIEAGAGAPGS